METGQLDAAKVCRHDGSAPSLLGGDEQKGGWV
jgi:hypothetical protein